MGMCVNVCIVFQPWTPPLHLHPPHQHKQWVHNLGKTMTLTCLLSPGSLLTRISQPSGGSLSLDIYWQTLLPYVSCLLLMNIMNAWLKIAINSGIFILWMYNIYNIMNIKFVFLFCFGLGYLWSNIVLALLFQIMGRWHHHQKISIILYH